MPRQYARLLPRCIGWGMGGLFVGATNMAKRNLGALVETSAGLPNTCWNCGDEIPEGKKWAADNADRAKSGEGFCDKPACIEKGNAVVNQRRGLNSRPVAIVPDNAPILPDADIEGDDDDENDDDTPRSAATTGATVTPSNNANNATVNHINAPRGAAKSTRGSNRGSGRRAAAATNN